MAKPTNIQGAVEARHKADSAKPMHIQVKKGLLHEKMGVKKGNKIGAGSLQKELGHAKATGNVKLEREVVFAQNAKKWHHK